MTLRLDFDLQLNYGDINGSLVDIFLNKLKAYEGYMYQGYLVKNVLSIEDYSNGQIFVEYEGGNVGFAVSAMVDTMKPFVGQIFHNQRLTKKEPTVIAPKTRYQCNPYPGIELYLDELEGHADINIDVDYSVQIVSLRGVRTRRTLVGQSILYTSSQAGQIFSMELIATGNVNAKEYIGDQRVVEGMVVDVDADVEKIYAIACLFRVATLVYKKGVVTIHAQHFLSDRNKASKVEVPLEFNYMLSNFAHKVKNFRTNERAATTGGSIGESS